MTFKTYFTLPVKNLGFSIQSQYTRRRLLYILVYCPSNAKNSKDFRLPVIFKVA